MKADERRKKIIAILMSKTDAISGGELSKELMASRQIIVNDIATLKSEGVDIVSTNKGYILNGNHFRERVFKVRHSSEETENELSQIVCLGGVVVDVFVNHKVYGKINAELNISSKSDIDNFMEGIKTGKSTELMHITAGYHYHTIRAASEKILDEIEQSLKSNGYLVE